MDASSRAWAHYAPGIIASQLTTYRNQSCADPPIPPAYPPPPPPHDAWDLRTSGALHAFDYVVNDLIGANGVIGVDKIVDILHLNGMHTLPLDFETGPIPIGPVGNVSLRVGEVNVSGAIT